MKRTVLTSILASLLVASSIGQTAGQSKPATTTPKPVPASTTPVTTTSTTPAAPAPSDTTSTQTTKKAKLITNVFTDADIKTVIQEIASAVGQSIIADTSVKGTDINIEFKKDTAESALEKLSYAAGLLWKKKGDLYLVSTGMPDAPLFSEFAETKVYTPHTQPAENLYGLLTRSFTAYAQLDKAANMIEVTAPPKQMEAVWKALTAADSPRKQFCVEAMVTEINSQDIKTAGFSWNWQYFAQGADLSLTYATATAADIVNLKSLITLNKAELRANPKVVAQEGHEASITVGNDTYFSMTSGTSNYQSVQYQKIDTGITLKFTGYIETDGMVNLHLQPEVSDAVVLVNGNPQTTIRKADTYLRIRFGDTVALGGMIIGTKTKQTNKTPILGDLPLIGSAFRSTTTEKDHTEVVIMITPRMIEDAVRPTDQPVVAVKS
jgi:type II secretory pathway component GspD/PulD (secretin)